MADIATVKIDDGNGGYIIINDFDFDETIHKLYEEIPIQEKITEQVLLETVSIKRRTTPITNTDAIK